MIRAFVIGASLLLAAGGGVAHADTAQAVSEQPAAAAPPAAPASGPALAPASAAPKAWSSMSPRQQQVLHGYQDKWNSLPRSASKLWQRAANAGCR